MTDAERIIAAIADLYDVYTPTGVGLFLTRHIFGDPSLIDRLAEGRVDEFVDRCAREVIPV